MSLVDRAKALTAEDLIRRYNLNGLSKDRQIINTINDGLTKVNVIINDYAKIVSSYAKDQVDNLITTWFFSGIPTLENKPFVDFTAPENKIGDLYYDKETGNVYQLSKVDDNYQWDLIDDEVLRQSLALANSSVDTTDGKRNLFTDTPVPPYEVGDVWYQDNIIKRCRSTRSAGDFNEVDWCLQKDYTDDCVLSDTTAVLNQFKITVESDYATKTLLETTTDEIKGSVEAVTTKTEILENELTNKADVVNVEELTQRVDTVQTATSQSTIAIEELKVNDVLMTEKMAEFEITVDEINSKVENTIDISKEVQGIGTVTLENAYEGQLHYLSIKGNISLLFFTKEKLYGYPNIISDTNIISEDNVISSGVPYGNDVLYPSDELYLKDTILTIDDIEYKLDFDYLNYINDDVCDEFIYKDGICQIIRRVGIDENFNMYPLEKEVIENRKGIDLMVKSNSTITLNSFSNAILNVEYLTQNDYTEVFAPQVEVQSQITQMAGEIKSEVSSNYATKGELTTAKTEIKQTTDSISSTVSKKIGSEEVVSSINQSAEEVKITGNRLVVEADNFELDKNGNMICTNAKVTGEVNSTTGNIGGWIINSSGLTNGTVFLNSDGSSTIYTVADLIVMRNYIMGVTGFDLPPQMIQHYDLDGDGSVSGTDYVILQNLIGISMN